MKIPVVAEYTPEQRRALASAKLDSFFSSVSPELKERVNSLPARIAKMNARTAIKLQEILRTADQLSSHAADFAACAKGCGHCCHVSVPIADFEARHIGDNIKTVPVPLKRSVKHDLVEFSEKTPCPFLHDGSCSIYQFRPLTCRLHVNFDVDNYWCLHENWKKPEAIIPRPTIHALISAYQLLTEQAQPVMADIRDFFPNGKTI